MLVINRSNIKRFLMLLNAINLNIYFITLKITKSNFIVTFINVLKCNKTFIKLSNAINL